MSAGTELETIIGLVSSPLVDYQRRGINAFARALYQQPEVLDGYLQFSPQLTELAALWETVSGDRMHDLHAPLLHFFAVVFLHPKCPLEVQAWADKHWSQLEGNLRNRQPTLLVATLKMLTSINRRRPHYVLHKFKFELLGKWCEGPSYTASRTSSNRSTQQALQRVHHAFVEFAMSFLEGDVKSAIETVLLMPTFLSLALKDLRRLPQEAQEWIFEVLHQKVLDSPLISANLKIQSLCRPKVCAEIISCMRPGYYAELASERFIRGVMQLLVQAVQRRPPVANTRDLNTRPDLKPARFLLQFVSAMLPHRCFTHLNVIVDTFTSLPSLAIFYVSVFFNAKWKKDMDSGKILCIVNVVSRLLALPIPPAALALTSTEDLIDTVVPAIFLRTRLMSWTRSENRLVLLQTLQLATAIADRFHRLMCALKARPEGLSHDMASRLMERFEAKAFHPDVIQYWAFCVHRHAEGNPTLEYFVVSRLIVLVWYYFLYTPSFRGRCALDLLPFPLKHNEYDGWLKIPPTLQRACLVLLLHFTPEPTLWTTLAVKRDHPTAAKTLLSFLHDLGPEPEGDAEGAETRHLAAGVLANVLLQLAYYTATEAQQLEAYAWIYCLRRAEGKDETVISFWRLMMHSITQLRYDIRQRRQIPRDTLLVHYAKKLNPPHYNRPLRLLADVQQQLAEREPLVAWMQQVQQTLARFQGGLKRRTVEAVVPADPPPEALPEAPVGAGAGEARPRKRKAAPQGTGTAVAAVPDGAALVAAIAAAAADEGVDVAAERLVARAQPLVEFLLSDAAQPGWAGLLAALSKRRTLRVFARAVAVALFGEEPSAAGPYLLTLLLIVACHLQAEPSLDRQRKAFRCLVAPALRAAYTGTLSDQDTLVYRVLRLSRRPAERHRNPFHAHHYLVGRALRRHAGFARRCASFEDLQVATFDELLDSSRLQQAIGCFPITLSSEDGPVAPTVPGQEAFRKYWMETCQGLQQQWTTWQALPVVHATGDDRGGGGIHDPRYVLPLAYCVLHTAHNGGPAALKTLISLRRWVKSGLLSYVVCALGMDDWELRGLAYGCLGLFLQLAHRTNQVPAVEALLLWAGHGITDTAPQLSMVHAAFVAQALLTLDNPLAPEFPPLTAYLSGSQGLMDLATLPGLYQMQRLPLENGTVREAAQMKAFLVTAWALGVRSAVDAALLRDADAYQLLMNEYYNSCVIRSGDGACTQFQPVRVAILTLLRRAVAIDVAAQDLLLTHCLPQFLSDVLLQAPRRGSPEAALAVEVLTCVYRWMGQAYPMPAYWALWAGYSHVLTYGVVQTLLRLAGESDLTLPVLQCLEGCYETYLVTTGHRTGAAEEQAVGEPKAKRRRQDKAPEAAVVMPRLPQPLICQESLKNVAQQLGRGSEWNTVRPALSALLARAAADHAAFGLPFPLEEVLEGGRPSRVDAPRRSLLEGLSQRDGEIVPSDDSGDEIPPPGEEEHGGVAGPPQDWSGPQGRAAGGGKGAAKGGQGRWPAKGPAHSGANHRSHHPTHPLTARQAG